MIECIGQLHVRAKMCEAAVEIDGMGCWHWARLFVLECLARGDMLCRTHHGTFYEGPTDPSTKLQNQQQINSHADPGPTSTLGSIFASKRASRHLPTK